MLGLGVLRLEIRTDGAAIHPNGNPVVERTRADQREFFESDQVIVLASARPGGPRPDSREGLRWLADLHRALAAQPGVHAKRVRSLATLIDPRPETPIVLSRNFLDEVPEAPTEYEALRARIAASPLAPGLFLAPSGAAALYVPALPGADRDRLVSDLQRLLAEQATFDVRLTGPVTAEVLLGRAVLADLSRLVPLMVGVVALLLFLCLRSIAGVLVPMAEIAIVLLCTLGAMGHLGVPITLVTTILPVMLMAVSVTDEIHLLERFRAHLRASDPAAGERPDRARVRAAMERALRDLARPIVLTSLTTAAGFLSFLTASMDPLRHFALFLAFGVLIALGLTFTFVPALIVVLPPSWLDEWGARSRRRAAGASALERLLARHRGAAALGGLLLVAAAAPGLRSLFVQDSWVASFAPDSELVSAERDFNREFWGSYRFDVVLDGSTRLFFMGADGLRLTDALAAVAAAGPHVGGVMSHGIAFQIAADAGGERARVYELPPERIAEIARLLSYVSRRTDLDQVLSVDGSSARLRLFVKEATHRRAEELQAYLERELPPLLEGTGVGAQFSGDLPLAHAVVGDIVSNQLRSVGWTVVGVALLLWISVRSVSLTAALLVPLAAGIVLLLGVMGYAGLPIGIATSMFTAVTIGVGVDFAIHFEHAYRRERARATDPEPLLLSTFASAGREIRWNAWVLAGGLAVLGSSALGPNRSLGLLLAAAMLVCYAATFLLLPALLERLAARASRE